MGDAHDAHDDRAGRPGSIYTQHIHEPLHDPTIRRASAAPVAAHARHAGRARRLADALRARPAADARQELMGDAATRRAATAAAVKSPRRPSRRPTPRAGPRRTRRHAPGGAGAGDNTKALAEPGGASSSDHDLGPDGARGGTRHCNMPGVPEHRERPGGHARPRTVRRGADACKAIALVPTEEGPHHGISRVLFQMRRMKELCEHRAHRRGLPGSALANYNYASSLESRRRRRDRHPMDLRGCAPERPERQPRPRLPSGRGPAVCGSACSTRPRRHDRGAVIDPTHEPALRLKMSVRRVAANAPRGTAGAAGVLGITVPRARAVRHQPPGAHGAA